MANGTLQNEFDRFVIVLLPLQREARSGDETYQDPDRRSDAACRANIDASSGGTIGCEKSMEMPPPETLTRLLKAWGEGDVSARDRLFPLVYAELRRRAARYLRREQP